MAWLTSTRERRLWAWTLAVLIAIYAAGVLAGSLVEAIGSAELVGRAFATGLGLAIVAVVGLALVRRSRGEVWIAIGVASTYLMIPVRSGVSMLERTHLFEYGVLAVLLYEALVERRTNGINVPVPALLAIAGTSSFGWVDEAVQGLVPNRVYDLRDVAVNALAAIVAVTSLAMLRWVRRSLAGRSARRPKSPNPPR